jgi:hypothetical protein
MNGRRQTAALHEETIWLLRLDFRLRRTSFPSNPPACAAKGGINSRSSRSGIGRCLSSLSSVQDLKPLLSSQPLYSTRASMDPEKPLLFEFPYLLGCCAGLYDALDHSFAHNSTVWKIRFEGYKRNRPCGLARAYGNLMNQATIRDSL